VLLPSEHFGKTFFFLGQEVANTSTIPDLAPCSFLFQKLTIFLRGSHSKLPKNMNQGSVVMVMEALQKNVIWHGRDVGICVQSEEGRLNKG